MGPACHIHAHLGGILGVHGLELIVERVLEGAELIQHVLLVRVADGRAVDLPSVQNVAAQTLKGEVIGVSPVLGIHLVAGNSLPFAVGVLHIAGAPGAEAVGLLGADGGHLGAHLIALIHVLQQHGIVGHEHVVGHVADADPAHSAGLHRAVLEQLEDLDLLVAGLADAAELVEVEHVILGQLAVGGDVGVHGDDPAVLDVGDGELGVVLVQVVLGVVIIVVQELQTVHHTGRAHPGRRLGAQIGVGGPEVDDVLLLVAHEGTGGLGRGDEALGGDDVLIVQIHLTDDGQVGLQEDDVVIQADGHILMAGAVLDVPDLVLVADEDAGVRISAVLVIDAGQQLHALAGGTGLR